MAFDFGSEKPSDPTADFLAREREAAGVLSGDADLFGSSSAPAAGGAMGDDFERSASAFPALDNDGIPASTAGGNAAGSTLGFGFDDEPEPVIATRVDANDEVGKFEQNFPELDDAPATNGNGASYGDTDDLMSAPAPASLAPTASRSAAAVAPTQPTYSYNYDNEPESEPEAVRAWRESQKNAIAKRDAEGERKKAEAISKAEQDIDNFYAEYNAKKEKNIAANKETEAKFQEERNKQLAEGTTWDRVTNILELKNSQSKTIARSGPGASDLGRMKEVYLKLRREGERAPGAAGY
ncbi:related to CLC1 - clathrin light chain [Melanopsichium pennsylvanicum]|uniref:Clathrin light chain n=2 Tax=Melanopsichium pennsylvanicum TaxID=63383 RepID=A0AAJ4XKC8_9BASI|nr:related to CLC1-clathrin light chain [Melanopsichium pennsylvanicum 4]SNX82703.1 related to CLC1 - clathrin light chain [Melanopsichium pennsylvanicum]